MTEFVIKIDASERMANFLDCLCSFLLTLANAAAALATQQQAGETTQAPAPVKAEKPVINEHPVDAVPPATADDVQTVAPAPDPAPAAAPAKFYTLEEVRKAVMAMSRKGIRIIDIAATIGKTEKTARAKLNGETDFTVTEAILIQRAYFGDQSYDYLFGH